MKSEFVMIKQISIYDYWHFKNNGVVLIDVRSPHEFKKGHIDGAINIPLFTDNERAKIGTLYKHKSREEAILEGLAIVGPKLKKIVIEAKEVAQNNSAVLYCWRGGLRSYSVAWLLDISGFNVQVIKGGYKAYRKFILEQFTKPYKLIMLGGPTGSKKTEILQFLKANGEQVIDLEQLAQHKGSAFGNLGGNEQPHTETFENNLSLTLLKLNHQKNIWIEDESKTIGTAHIPNEFWKKMKSAPLIYLELPIEKRIEYLIETYGKYPKEELQKAIDKIKKRLGGLAYQQASEALLNNDLRKTARIILNYYDAAYKYNSYKREDKTSIYHLKSEKFDVEEVAQDLLNFVKNIHIPTV